MRLELHESWAAARLATAPPGPRKKIRAALTEIARDPFPSNPRLDARVLQRDPGKEQVYRARVGNWRIVYVVRDTTVMVIRVMRREEGYEWLE